MSTPTHNGPLRPWYRQLWPWLLMLPPAFSVAGGVTMIFLANNTPRALVVEDYSRIEAITNERFERDARAAELGLEALLRFADSPARVDVALTAQATFDRPRALLLVFRHATNPAADRELTLARLAGSYSAEAVLLPGRYRIELFPEDRSWRLGGELLRVGGQITLEAQAVRAAAPRD